MTIRQVLLNGSGSSGDGTTWNDLSDATSAYIGVAGFASAINASVAGDTVYVKGSGSSASAMLVTAPAGSGGVSNPVRVLGCKSATTNNQGSIVQSDLIPGLRTGNATPAYDDGDMPVATVTGASDILFDTTSCYIYGVKFVSNDNLTFNTAEEGQLLEECWLNVTGSTDQLQLTGISGTAVFSRYINCRIDTVSGGLIGASGPMTIIGGRIEKSSGTGGILGFTTSEIGAFWDIQGVDFSNSTDPNIFTISKANGFAILRNCRFPASHSLTTGTSVGKWRIEAYGCGETASGISTSEQSFKTASHEGTVDVETTKVRTGGADDGAAGGFSHDFSTIAGNTTEGYNSLYGPWMKIWVEGDGTSKTLTVYFTSDSGNTRATDWDDDEVWLEALYPDDAGGSKYDYQTLQMTLLGTASAVTDDTGSTWAAGTQNDQKLQATIAPDYEGMVYCRVHFAPGANAETIYVDPEIEIA